MKGLIYTGGEWPDRQTARRLYEQADFVVCCDGAAVQAQKYNLPMDALLGDMDSIDPAVLQFYQSLPDPPEILTLPVEKDWTDTEYAVSYALEKGCTELTFCGGLGKRMDHSMGQIQILYDLCQKKIPHALYAENTFAVAFSTEYTLKTAPGQTFSLLPFEHNCCITILGAKYPLDHHPLPMGKTLGISNQAIHDRVIIQVHQGTVLLLSIENPEA